MMRLEDERFAWEADNPRRVPWVLPFQVTPTCTSLGAVEEKHGNYVSRSVGGRGRVREVS